MADREQKIRIRIRLVRIGFLLAFGLIVARSYQLQVVNREVWEQRAERQHQKVLPLTPQRGTIYDRNGEELALSIEVDSIFIEPGKMENPKPAAAQLAKALSLPAQAMRDKIASDRGFVWLKRQVSAGESAKVRKLDLPGVGFIKEHHRFYPNSEIGAQVIGFTGLDPQGLEGLELEYDSLVFGQGGFLVTERDALGRSFGSGQYEVRGRSRGADLYLTLDKNIQYIVEKELAQGVKKAGARAGSVVVLEPASGRVLAMASQPDFNPNAFSEYRPNQWRNRTLTDTFEPGSTFKPLLLASALNEGLVRPGQIIDCEKGAYAVGGKVIHDHHAYDKLTVREVLKVSSNIGAAKIAKILERDRFYSYLRDFGFGTKTGIDLPGEVPGLVRPPSQWFEIDMAAMSFGQGLSVTPLQLANAVAAIANGGYLMTPYLVERIVGDRGETIETRGPQVVRRVIDPQTAALMLDLMTGTTEEGGTGTLAAIPGYRVAGKTGTAQKVDPVTGGYSVDKRVGSFVGVVPANAPRLVILVVIDEPQGIPYGGVVAAPVFAQIAAKTLRYLKVPPTGPMDVPPLPEAKVVRGAVDPIDIPSLAGALGDLSGGRGMPDFRGMSLRQVLRGMEQLGLNIKLLGSGRVVEQSPLPGGPIRYGSEVWVRLAPPS